MEKDKEKKTDDADIDTTKSEVVKTATEDVHLEEIDTQVEDIEETDVILEEPDPYIEDALETEEKTEDEKGATGVSIPRRSTREKKKPKQFESYVMHQVTSFSVDKREQTLQNLIGSGILINWIQL